MPLLTHKQTPCPVRPNRIERELDEAQLDLMCRLEQIGIVIWDNEGPVPFALSGDQVLAEDEQILAEVLYDN